MRQHGDRRRRRRGVDPTGGAQKAIPWPIADGLVRACEALARELGGISAIAGGPDGPGPGLDRAAAGARRGAGGDQVGAGGEQDRGDLGGSWGRARATSEAPA